MVLRFTARLVLFFLFIPNGYGYSLTDHAQLTRTAALTLSRCFPERFRSGAIKPIVQANQWEDKNVLRKWFEYSHFYNPEREFSSLRMTSRDRIMDLDSKMERHGHGPVSQSLIGKALHHIQDMTVPPHVIPVNHFWTDGFEKLEVAVEPTFSFASCQALIEEAVALSVVDLHRQLAEQTLNRVRSQWIGATRLVDGTQRKTAIPLVAFWSPGGNDEWGSYGALGNSFGEQELRSGSGIFRVSSTEYTFFKQQQLQSALRASQLVLTKLYVLGI